MQAKERIESKVLQCPMTGCWLWNDYVTKNGYGRIRADGKTKFAHRYSYEVFVGKIPDGFEIDHLCRVRSCCNPAHLEAVTREVNQMRGMGFNAVNARKTHCVNGHELTEENLVKCKAYFRRDCNICHRARERAYYKAKTEARKG